MEVKRRRRRRRRRRSEKKRDGHFIVRGGFILHLDNETKKQNEMEHEEKHDMPIRTRFQESSAASDDSRACNLNDASDG